MIRKTVQRFSEKITLQPKSRRTMTVQPNFIAL